MLESVHDCYKNQQMCDKAFDSHAHAYALEFVPNCHKTQKQKMCNKAVNTYNSTMWFVSEYHKTQEICDKAVNAVSFAFHSVLDQYKTQELYGRVISEEHFMFMYCPDRHKTQKMCDEANDDCLAALKLIPDWFVISKTFEKFPDALLANDDILFFDEDFLLMKWVFLV